MSTFIIAPVDFNWKNRSKMQPCFSRPGVADDLALVGQAGFAADVSGAALISGFVRSDVEAEQPPLDAQRPRAALRPPRSRLSAQVRESWRD